MKKEVKERPTQAPSFYYFIVEIEALCKLNLPPLERERRLKRLICNKCCRRGIEDDGHYCDPDRCKFHNNITLSIYNLQKEEEERAARPQKKGKVTIETTKRHKDTIKLIGSWKKSIKGLRKKAGPNEQIALDQIEEKVNTNDITGTLYLIEKFGVTKLKEIRERHLIKTKEKALLAKQAKETPAERKRGRPRKEETTV